MRILIIFVICILISACSDNKDKPVTKTGLTKEQVMDLAEKNLKGEVTDLELKKQGVSISEPVKGDEAKELLIKELEALENEESKQK